MLSVIVIVFTAGFSLLAHQLYETKAQLKETKSNVHALNIAFGVHIVAIDVRHVPLRLDEK